jgi:2-keto-3-deoxy-L-rhamnonate aldolase RhmA
MKKLMPANSRRTANKMAIFHQAGMNIMVEVVASAAFEAANISMEHAPYLMARASMKSKNMLPTHGASSFSRLIRLFGNPEDIQKYSLLSFPVQLKECCGGMSWDK